MSNYVLLTSKYWHDELFKLLNSYEKNSYWFLIKSKSSFTTENLKKIKPKLIFIPHWSDLIPEEIFSNYECILFHMTDLPYGRGGSPLQNLIKNGHSTTKITAIKVTEGIDQGPIYLKKDLDLSGTAKEIFLRRF